MTFDPKSVIGHMCDFTHGLLCPSPKKYINVIEEFICKTR